ncbi:hypothetical protein BGC_64370 [Burkholderia sp. 3C]
MSLVESTKTIAVVDYWPTIENAETECILRIKSALQALGWACVSINRHGYLVDDALTHIDELQVEFVLALHFDSAKSWRAFTYYALWNPLDFYFQWNYREKSENILSNDAFLSCGSKVADDHARRLLKGAGREASAPFPTLFHAVHEPVVTPAVGRGKLFYVGINWEALSGRGGRHHELMKLLDQRGMLDIYGPEIFQNVRVWDGYASYQGEIPFDGKTLITRVAQSGIGLVLSSEAHIKSGLMSSRLFECLSAGVPIVCDQNRFASDNFGDLLFYIDTTQPATAVARRIEEHVTWIRENPAQAIERATKAQQIYLERFSLVENFRRLSESGPHRDVVAPDTPGSELNTVFIADECNPEFVSKIRAFALHMAGKQRVHAYALIPETSSAARVDEITQAFQGIEIVRFNRNAQNYIESAESVIGKLTGIVQSLSSDAIYQVVPPWERPVWPTIESMWAQLDAQPEMGYISGGFTILENVGKPHEGRATFLRLTRLSSMLDASAYFSCASTLYRHSASMADVFATFVYTPYFWQRLLSIAYQRFEKGFGDVRVASVVNHEYYIVHHRVSSHEQLMRESELITDVLGIEYADRNLRAAAVVHGQLVEPMAFVKQVDPAAARALLVKLYDSVKMPKFISAPIQWLWKKKVI